MKEGNMWRAAFGCGGTDHRKVHWTSSQETKILIVAEALTICELEQVTQA